MVNVYKIQKSFKSMMYENNYESVEDAIKWLRSKEFKYFNGVNSGKTLEPCSLNLQNAVKNEILFEFHIEIGKPACDVSDKECLAPWSTYKHLDRIKVLSKIGTGIEKKADLFSQLEILTRGVLAKDTKSIGVPLLAQYFKYYSSFAYCELDEEDMPSSRAAAIISDDNYLPHLGLCLAPALAAGYEVVLQVGLKLTPAAFLLNDIAREAGLPEGTLKIVSYDSSININEDLVYSDVEVMAIFDDMNYNLIRNYVKTFYKHVIVFKPLKAPCIIFDSADIDSAVENIIDSCWGYRSMLPCSTDTLLVQENIMEIFLKKLKSKLATIKVSSALDRNADISSSNTNVEALNRIVEDAKNQGIEVFRTENDCGKWSPTLLIGGTLKTNSGVEFVRDESNVVTLLPFRSIDEAVILANNNRGMFASIWSENIGVVNEVTRKLEMSNIYVNSSFGIFSPEVVLTPIKDSRWGNFGGLEGFLEYKRFYDKKIFDINPPFLSFDIEKIVATAKKGQELWKKVSTTEKMLIFQQFFDDLEELKEKFCLSESDSDWLTNAKSWLYTVITDPHHRSIGKIISGYYLNSMCVPRGVVLVGPKVPSLLVTAALLEGNSVIIVTLDEAPKAAFNSLSKKLPNGVLTVMNDAGTLLNDLRANRQVNECNFTFTNHLNVSQVKAALYGKVTYRKNVWSDLGKSSTCSF